MPLVTVSVIGKRDAGYKRVLLDSVQQALVASGVPASDRFQRVVEVDRDNIVVDPRYPDLTVDRNDDFVLVEVLWSVGRSVVVKRKVVADIVAGIARGALIDPQQVMVVITETQWENWAFAGGRLPHA